MITNYYTLVHIAAELDREFAGRTVNEIFTQYRGELVITCNEMPAVIIAGCEPADNFIYARKSFARARRNSASLFPDVPGLVIEKVFMHTADRQFHIRLNNRCELVVQLFGSKANVLLVNTNGIISQTFLKKPDAKITAIESLRANSGSIVPETFLSTNTGQLLKDSLKRMLPQFGPVLIKELLARTGLDGEQTINAFPDNEIVRMLATVQRLKEELLGPPSPRVYLDRTLPVRFSIIPLHQLKDFTSQNYQSVSEAIQTYRAHMHHDKTILQEKEDIVRLLEREHERTERTLHTMRVELGKPDRAKQYELFGKLLISQLHLLKKGDTTAVVEDFVNESNALVEIPLDQHLAPAKNAERYFEKAEKSRHAAEEQHRRILELTERKKSVSLLLERMEEVSSADDLKHYAEENRSALSQFGFNPEKSGHMKKEEPLPFRVFTVTGGFQVWAGKSGENNDLLSTRHTAKNDLWFHARGVGGSHVVLKIGTGKGEVSKQAIDQAAAIAAYYSKMKKSKLVPVTMCEGKYVRKPKGVPAGTVTVEREKTIYAEPGLPPPQ